MVTTQRPHVPTEQGARRAPLRVIISAWAVPILVVGQFAMLAIVPVTLVVMGTLRDSRLRALRWWAVALAATYATPLGPLGDRAGPRAEPLEGHGPRLRRGDRGGGGRIHPRLPGHPRALGPAANPARVRWRWLFGPADPATHFAGTPPGT